MAGSNTGSSGGKWCSHSIIRRAHPVANRARPRAEAEAGPAARRDRPTKNAPAGEQPDGASWTRLSVVHRRAGRFGGAGPRIAVEAGLLLAVSDPAAHPALLAPHLAATFASATTGHAFSPG